MKELPGGILGHTLYFEAQDAQSPHDIRHAPWNHPQILSKYQHIGGPFQRRQLAHGLVFPEVLLPDIKVVDIKIFKLLLHMPFQVSEGGSVLHRNAKMEL